MTIAIVDRSVVVRAEEALVADVSAFVDGLHRQELQDMYSKGESFRNLVVPLTVDGEERWWSISGRRFEPHIG